MHRRGTHCGRSNGKTQISRAQSRWNNGPAEEKAEELSVDETIAGPVAGKVHATTRAGRAVKSTAAGAGAGAAGSGTETGADSVTQQQAG